MRKQSKTRRTFYVDGRFDRRLDRIVEHLAREMGAKVTRSQAVSKAVKAFVMELDEDYK